jgi:hypothetical protein
MATEYGLFDERREFLLCLRLQDSNAEEFMTAWARVGLLDLWDLADGGTCLQWARDNLDPRWRPLLTQVIQDRALGWDPADPPRPGSLDATYEFAAYAQSFAR